MLESTNAVLVFNSIMQSATACQFHIGQPLFMLIGSCWHSHVSNGQPTQMQQESNHVNFQEKSWDKLQLIILCDSSICTHMIEINIFAAIILNNLVELEQSWHIRIIRVLAWCALIWQGLVRTILRKCASIMPQATRALGGGAGMEFLPHCDMEKRNVGLKGDQCHSKCSLGRRQRSISPALKARDSCQVATDIFNFPLPRNIEAFDTNLSIRKADEFTDQIEMHSVWERSNPKS